MNTDIKKGKSTLEQDLQRLCMEATDASSLFREYSELLMETGACSGAAAYLFEHDRKFFSPGLEGESPYIESLGEGDYFFLEDLSPLTLHPSVSGGAVFADKLSGFSLLSVVRDAIPYAVFLIREPGEGLPLPLFSLLFVVMERLLVTAGTDAAAMTPVRDDSAIRKRTYELDSVTRASMDMSGMSNEDLYGTFLLNVIGVSVCESAALFLSQNQQGNEFMVKSYRGIDERIETVILHDRLSLIGRILAEKKPVVLSGFDPKTMSDRMRDLVEQFDFSVVFPMLVRGRVEGLLFLGRRLSGQGFSGHVMDSVELLLNQMGMALESNRLNEIKFAFSRYVTNQLIDELLENPDILRLGGTERDVTVLFADIRNFTSMSESLPPEDVVGILNTYMSALTEVIFKYEGTIDKYIGDCLMATFGVPIETPDSQERAVMAAIDMQKTVRALNTARRERGEREVDIGIGINTGTCISGNMGSTQRMDYTVIGDNVNIAARLEQLARPGQILITGPLLREVRYLVTAEKLPAVVLKGKSAATDIWEVRDLISDRIISFLEKITPEKIGFYKKVFRLAQRLAGVMEMPHDALKKLRVCLYLYDIGMLKLPPDLRSSLGPFTDEEKQQLTIHPEYGARMLTRLRFFPEAIEAARYHHERWDGSGYPEGRKGEAIPLFARIIGLVESYVAMTASREYRETLTEEEALAEIRNRRGVLYDPELADAFITMMG